MLCATLLTPETVEVYNLPDILGINNLIKLFADLRRETTKIGEGSYRFKGRETSVWISSTPAVPQTECGVAQVGDDCQSVSGPFREGGIAKPGGDKIGRRRRYALFGNSKTRSRIFLYSPKNKSMKSRQRS